MRERTCATNDGKVLPAGEGIPVYLDHGQMGVVCDGACLLVWTRMNTPTGVADDPA